MASAKKSATTKKPKTRSASTAKTRPEPYRKNASTENFTGRIASAFVFLFLACFTAVSYFVNDGTVIVRLREFMTGILGYGYWACAVCFLWVAFLLFKGSGRLGLRVACVLLIPILFSAFVDVLSYTPAQGVFDLSAEAEHLFQRGQDFRSGGVISGLLVMGMVTLLSKLGTGIVLTILMLSCIAFAVSEPDSWFTPVQPRKIPEHTEGIRTARFNPADLIRFNENNENDIIFPEQTGRSDLSAAASTAWQSTQKVGNTKRPAADIPLEEIGETVSPAVPVRKAASSKTTKKPAFGLPDPAAVEANKASEKIPEKKSEREVRINGDIIQLDPSRAGSRSKTDAVKPLSPEEAAEVAGVSLGQSSTPVSRRATASTSRDVKEEKPLTKEELAIQTKAFAKAASAPKEMAPYVYPTPNLLQRSKSAGADSREELIATKERLENSLHSFGIFSSVVNITHGPTVTRYDIELEQGVKLTKVTNLSNDIALNLGVSNVRIAPIPDEISTVGIEVPNKIVNTVGLRELIESENFRAAKSRLTFAIGKDIAGNAICGNISKLPHLLIAGTTGSGKSVCMNSLILSLLYKARPDEVKFIMIDPKMVELGIYNSIPHLYVPVVTDPKKAAGALQWAVVEMLKRYRLFSEAGVRDLETYNNYCRNNGEETLPQMVIVIDELADLMMAASKEVEESICRIAQMGRASGQHLIIATQRPSADVITGLMKANIPSRIAFAVSSTLESRIILDQGGADKLIGHGDMLYAPIGCGKPLRVQGAFVSDEEREKVISFISKHTDGSAEENEDLKQYMENAAEDKKGDSSSPSSAKQEESSLSSQYDEMLSQAAEVVLEMKQCSVSMLQRRLKLGYSRAARIVDQMEELGIVGPYEGAKPRSVPIDRQGWQELQVQLGLASADDFALAAEMSEAAGDSSNELS